MARFRLVNLKGDLFATTFCFATQAVLRIVSSLVLTRILLPDDYGVMTILMSIVFIVEMLADLGLTIYIVRSPHGDEPLYLNTAWTIRLARSLVNFTIVFSCAHYIALLYDAPTLEGPLRVFSFWFLIGGLESMSFPLATRRKRSRVTMYSELSATLISTTFVLIYCHYSRDYWGMVYGTLLNRLLITGMSYRFYPELRPRLQFSREAAREIFGFTRFSMPSSILTLALTQLDKAVFLRLFNLTLLGVYGLAGSFASQVEGLVTAISQKVLYPRCAHNFRENPETAAAKYYTENVRVFASILTLPAAVGGAAYLIIAVLYPARYAQAAAVLQAFMVRANLLSLALPAEDLLIAAGETRVFLIGNILRACWMVVAALPGYYLFGFMGFVYAMALSGLPPLIYYWSLQARKGMLVVRYEVYKIGFSLAIAAAAYVVSNLLQPVIPHLQFKHL